MKIKKVMEGPRDGEVRCLTCFERFRPAEGAERAKCPQCAGGFTSATCATASPSARVSVT